MHLGIDASNIRPRGRSGGTVTHLVEILRAGQPEEHDIERVTVWCGRRTLEQLPRKPWLRLIHERLLDGPLPGRLLWQHTKLAKLAKQDCDVLFVPGGLYMDGFRPFVAMSQNLLPFEPVERRRYGLSWAGIRLYLLEYGQIATFRRAAGVIFLTETARQAIESYTGSLPGRTAIIPHGIADDFRRPPKKQQPLSEYSQSRPFRWLYVSTVALYKHQWHVVEAVARLRNEGVPLTLDLVGPADPLALRRLRQVVKRVDPGEDFVHYRGPVPYTELASYYHQADGFVFASSCENMPIILLEAMASGLPIACSKRSPMPEVLGDAGVYFDPEQPETIVGALYSLGESADLRELCARSAYERAQGYSWDRCARRIFGFIAEAAL